MEAMVEKVLLLPRYTSFVGAGTRLTQPMNVRAYASAIVTFTFVAGLGAGPTVLISLQESPDLEIWTDVGDTLAHGTPESRTFKFEWIRLKLVISGTDPAFTCWCVGDFVLRE